MEKYLYEDLYQLEESHWWHIAKREAVCALLGSCLRTVPARILDFGCGTGGNLRALSRFGECFGVDASAEAVKFCEQKGLTKVSLFSGGDLQFDADSFDAVTLLDVLEHTEESETLDAIRRVLRPGGYAIVNVPAYQWLWSRWDEVLHHKRRYTKASLTKALVAHGFEVCRISYMYSFLLLPVMVVRWVKSRGSDNEYVSDFKHSSPLMNNIGRFLSRLERWCVVRSLVPCGTSVIALARKI